MKSAWRKLLFVAVLAGLVVAIWWLQPPRVRTGADFLPADTPACLIIPDFPATRQRWATTSTGGTNQITGGNGVLATVWGEVPRWSKELGPLVARGAERFGDGEVFVALTGLQTTPTIAPELAVGIQLGARRAAVGPWREELRGLLRREFPKTAPEKQPSRGMSFEQWQPHPGLELCVAELEGYLVFTLGAAPMMEIIERAADRSRATLAGSAEFRQAGWRLPARRDVTLVVQAAPFAAKLEPLSRWLPQLRSLGAPFAGARFIGWGQSLGSNDVSEAIVIARTPAPRRSPEPVPVAALGRLPSSCAAAVVARVEPREAYQWAMQTVVGLGQREWAKSLALMEVAWGATGVDFASDLLGNLGSQCVVAWDWPATVKSPRLLWGAEVRDAARFTNVTQRLAASRQVTPLRWRVSDGWLWLSSSSDALEQMAQAGAAGKSLASQSQWANRIAGMPRNGWLWLYADTARFATTGRPEAARLAPFLGCVASLGENSAVTMTSPMGVLTTVWLAVDQMAGASTSE